MVKKKKTRNRPGIKSFATPESYRRFRAYVHMRTPSGKLAKSPSQSISGRTPPHKKERVIEVGGELHYPELSGNPKKKKAEKLLEELLDWPEGGED